MFSGGLGSAPPVFPDPLVFPPLLLFPLPVFVSFPVELPGFVVLFFGVSFFFSGSCSFSSSFGFVCISQSSYTLPASVVTFLSTGVHNFSCSFGNTAPYVFVVTSQYSAQ